MSSHHIVRDEQEPALFIQQVSDKSWPNVQQLLEWSPTVIVPETCAEEVLSLGVKVDLVIARGDREELKTYQSPLDFLRIEDDRYLPHAFSYLKEHKHRSLNIICDRSEIAQLLSMMLAHGSDFDLSFYEGGRRHILISRDHFQKWLPVGEIGVWAPQGVSCAVVYGKSRFYDKLSNETFILSSPGMVDIKCEKPPFLFVETL